MYREHTLVATLQHFQNEILYEVQRRAPNTTVEPPETFQEFLWNLFHIVNDHYSGSLILLLDEFHPNAEFLKVLRSLHHHLVIEDARIAVVTAGLSDPAEIELGYSSPYNISNLIRLDVLEPDEAALVVSNGFSRTPIELSSNTVDALVTLSGCAPAILQYLCQWVYDDVACGKLTQPLDVDTPSMLELIVNDGRVLERFSYLDVVLSDRELLEIVCRVLQDQSPRFQAFLPGMKRAIQYSIVKRCDNRVDFVSPLHRFCLEEQIKFYCERLNSAALDDAVRDFLSSFNPSSIQLNVFRSKEVHMSQDNISIENVVGPVNIKSKLRQVTQTVTQSHTLEPDYVTEWAQLVDELAIALETARAISDDDAERIVSSTDTVGKELTKTEPNRGFLKISLDGLKESAKAVDSIAPAVLSVVSKIIQFVDRVLP
ncbi:hypothetical protein Enr10x_04240 [Gimesia panareensis]|uniref:Uncharacterized protein n=1 Tax=Gimesia panareensis TaxID=2527978 RepID=A0A517Q0I2_9PLAN|nr:hypothetical protein [Gimesia panareensis]QDT25130.1 hypothetical protein Enr10x_04240 [Gimesia panareensis]